MEKKKKETIHILKKEVKKYTEKSTEGIIQENQDLLLEVFRGKIPRKKLRFKIEQRLADWQFKENFEDEKKHLKLYRISLLLRLEDIRQSLNNPNISDNDRFSKLYELGIHRSELRDVEQKIETSDDHKDLDIARKLWEGGDQRVRHEMAEYLKDISPGLSYDNLQKKLTLLVKKYDRIGNLPLPRKRIKEAKVFR